MIGRRTSLLALGSCVLVFPFGATAQAPRKVWRIGFLGVTFAAGYAKELAAGLVASFARPGGNVTEKPETMPIEEPREFRMIVNLKLAKALGLKVSQAMLIRANEVIE